MRKSRMTLRSLSRLVAISLAGLRGAKAVLRPWPVSVFSSGGRSLTMLSDGSGHWHEFNDRTPKVSIYRLLAVVEWPDGRTSYHLRLPWLEKRGL